MGFWNGLARMIQGKPVFQGGAKESSSNETPLTSANISKAYVDSRGRKIIPKVVIEQCESDVNGSEKYVHNI